MVPKQLLFQDGGRAINLFTVIMIIFKYSIESANELLQWYMYLPSRSDQMYANSLNTVVRWRLCLVCAMRNIVNVQYTFNNNQNNQTAREKERSPSLNNHLSQSQNIVMSLYTHTHLCSGLVSIFIVSLLSSLLLLYYYCTLSRSDADHHCGWSQPPASQPATGTRVRSMYVCSYTIAIQNNLRMNRDGQREQTTTTIWRRRRNNNSKWDVLRWNGNVPAFPKSTLAYLVWRTRPTSVHVGNCVRELRLNCDCENLHL